MSKTKNLRENVIKTIDEVLLQAELSDAINNVINSDEAKKLVDCNYDKAMERINEMHKHAPENQKELENEAFEAVISKETFTEKVQKNFKFDCAISLLFAAANTDEIAFEKEVIQFKEKSSEEFMEKFEGLTVTLTNSIIGNYLKAAYAGYLSKNLPEDIPEEAKCFLEALMGFGVCIPTEVIFADIDNDDENEE